MTTARAVLHGRGVILLFTASRLLHHGPVSASYRRTRLCGMEREVLQWHLRAGWQLRHDTLAFTARPDDVAETSSNPYGVGLPFAKGGNESIPQALVLIMEAVRDAQHCLLVRQLPPLLSRRGGGVCSPSAFYRKASVLATELRRER
jgi:hypothetical protein